MIQAYKPGTSTEQNGDIVLFPTECTVTAKLNEVWVLEMTHPIDDEGRWKYIVDEGILKVPTWQTNQQLYRISQVEKTADEVHVIAYPIFMDARNQVFIQNLTVSGTGQTVLNQMLSLGPTTSTSPYGPLYNAVSNLSTARRATFELRNFIDCLNGNGDGPKFLDLWGGEIVFDNFTIYVNDRIGADRDVYVRYGKNISAVEYTVDYSDVCTRIYPQAYGGYPISSGQAWVDSPLVNTYDVLYIKNVVFDDIRLLEDVPDSDDSVNYTVCSSRSAMDTYLRQACRDMFDGGCDKPKVSMKIDIVDLASTDQYKDYADLETIMLGDTVHCVHNKLGITSDARAVGIVWDCARNRIQSVELGDFTFDYFRETSTKINAISRIMNPDGSLMAERVRGFLDATRTAIHAIRSTATEAHVMGVLFEDKVQDSITYGALGIGTKGLMIAKAWDETTNDWAWETAITADGILSPMIVTNTISGTSATNWWDLQLGEISFQTISDDVNSRISDAVGGIDTDMTALEICNAIFNDGRIKGFQTRTVNGKKEFYLSFSAFIGGQGQLGGSENGNGYLSIYDSNNSEIVRLSNKGVEAWNSSQKTVFKTKDNGIQVNNSYGYKIMDVVNNVAAQWGDQSEEHWGIAIYDGSLVERPILTLSDKGMRQMSRTGSTVNSYCYYLNGMVLFSSGGTDPADIGKVTPDGYIFFDDLFDVCLGTTKDTLLFETGVDFKWKTHRQPGSSSSTLVQTYATLNQYGFYAILHDQSDKRLKENFGEPMSGCMDLLKKIPIKSYDWKRTHKHMRAGIVAQDLQKVAPELVDKDSDGYLGITYGAMVPYLIQALKEQDARIAKLESMVESLLAKLEEV